MRDLIKAEWLRYRSWVLLYAFAHLLALAFLMRLADLGQQPLNVRRLFAIGYAVTGLLLGLHQMGTWRRPNQWLNLLHRPLAPRRIGLALFVAGSLSLTVAIAVPLFLAVTWQAFGSARIVDLRHVLIPVAAWLIGLCAYFVAAYGMLADRRYSASALVLLLWIALAKASGPAALAVQGLATAVAFAMAMAAFRPDLGTPPRSIVSTCLLAVPLQVAIYTLILVGGFIVEMGWIMLGTHPGNMPIPPAGGVTETVRMSPRDRMLAGLKGATSPEAPLWREQVALSEVHAVERAVAPTTHRQDLSNGSPMAFDDNDANIRWTFGHDRMRYEGMNTVTGMPTGELGIGADNAAFPGVATPVSNLSRLEKGDTMIAAGNTLYRYIASVKRIVPRLSLPEGERLLTASAVGGSVVVLGERTLYVYDTRHLLEGGMLSPRQRMPLPGHVGDLGTIELVELVDGYLVSFVFTAQAHDMRGVAPFQSVWHVDDQGQAMPIATRMLAADYPPLYRYRAWWPSPAIHALRDAAVGLFAFRDPEDDNDTPPVPASMAMLASIGMALSFLVGLWMVSRRAMSMSARIAWALVCGCVGVPAVACLWLMQPATEREPRPSAEPAPI